MKVIADELQIIATALGTGYMRAATLQDSNIITHYTDIDKAFIIYVGFGNAAMSFAGAMPVKAVETTVYVVDKKLTTDALAEQVDIQLEALEIIATSIVNTFTALQPILEYTLAPVTINDDMLIGYLLTFTPELQANGC